MKLSATLVLGALLLAACSSEPQDAGPPKLSGPDASIVATVDCGDDGVASVHVEYGSGQPIDALVGRNSTTLTAGGGSKTYSGNFGTTKGQADATLRVTTSPTRGTCVTTLTNHDGGEVLAKKDTPGKVTVEAVISAGG